MPSSTAGCRRRTPPRRRRDASYKRLLDSALRPEWAGAVRVGVASHNLFDVAWALERDRRRAVGDRDARGHGAGAGPCRAGRGRPTAPVLPDRARRRARCQPRLPRQAVRREHHARELPAGDVRPVAGVAGMGRASGAVPPVRRPALDGRHVAASAGRRRRRRTADSFVNEPDSDLTDSATRAAIWDAVGAPRRDEVPIVDDVDAIDAAVAARRVRCDRLVGSLGKRARRRAACCRGADVVGTRRRRSR